MRPKTWLSLAVLTGLSVLVAGDRARAFQAPALLRDRAFHEAIERPLSGAWEQVDLRTIARRISESQQISIVIDRRLDPSCLMQFAAEAPTVTALLERLLEDRDAVPRVVGNAIYLGPRTAGEKLRTLIALRTQELVEAGRSGARRGLLRAAEFRWDDLATPAELLNRISQSYQLTIEGSDVIPHDLWAGADLPAATLPEILSLILIQFDQTFRWSDGGAGIVIEPTPDRVVIERPHAAARGLSATATLGRIRQLFPDVEAKLTGSRVQVTATIEQHEQIERTKQGEPAAGPGKPAPARPTGKGLKRYTLRLKEIPLRSLLKTLERPEHGAWRFEFDDVELQSAGIRLDQRISLEVREAPLEDLLSAALKSTGLRFEVGEQTVRLFPR